MKKINAINIVNTVLIFVCILWYVFPYIHYRISSSISSMLICGVIFIIIIINKIQLKNFCILFSLCLIYGFVVSLFNLGFTFQGFYIYFISSFLFFSPIFFLKYINDNNDIKGIVFIRNIIFIFIALVFIRTYIEYQLNPFLARQMTSTNFDYGEDELFGYQSKNVGAFDFCYSMGVYGVYWFYNIINQQKTKKIFYIFIFLCLISILLLAQFSILFICLFISIGFIFYFQIKHPIFKILYIFLIIFLSCFISNILFYISLFIDSQEIGVRISELINFFNNGIIVRGTDMYGRIKCYSDGFNYFLQSPLIGNNDSVYNYSDGSHSTIIGCLLKSGLVGLAVYISIYIFNIKYIINNLNFQFSEIKNILIPCLVYLILLSLLNPIDNCTFLGFSLFMYLPLNIYIQQNSSK